VLIGELLTHLDKGESVKTMFDKTRVAVIKSTSGAQVPSVSDSLLDNIRLATADAGR
jgi:hypothetical protein